MFIEGTFYIQIMIPPDPTRDVKLEKTCFVCGSLYQQVLVHFKDDTIFFLYTDIYLWLNF